MKLLFRNLNLGFYPSLHTTTIYTYKVIIMLRVCGNFTQFLFLNGSLNFCFDQKKKSIIGNLATRVFKSLYDLQFLFSSC